MFEWTLFYRLLDLPDDLTSPTHYDLLGLTPDSCTPETVRQALLDRKNLLRQSIPGPQFIPLVLRFESEQLEPAARVLADPQIRSQYDEQLKKQDRQSPAEWIQAERTRVLQKARKLVLEHSNSDGTLDERQRPVLAEKLARLGFSQGDIRVLFQGIPTSTDHVPPPNEREMEFFLNAIDMARTPDGLANDDRDRLLNLAQHLGLPSEKARQIIQAQLDRPLSAQDQIRIVPEDVCASDSQTSPFPKITTSTDSQVFVVTDIVESSEPAPVAVIQTPLQPPAAVPVAATSYPIAHVKPRPVKLWIQLIKIMAPLLACGLFLAFIIYNLHEPIVPKARDRRTSETPEMQSNPDSVPEPENNQNVASPAPPVTTPSPVNPAQTESYTPSEIVTRIHQSFAVAPENDQLLADLALITLACREYAYSFVRKQPPSFNALNPILNANRHTEQAEILTANVQLSLDRAKSGTSTVPSDPQWLDTLETMLTPEKPKAVQYRAIEELAVDRSPQAADILVKILESNRKLDQEMIARILRALENTNDPLIPLRLVDLLENPPHRSFVQPILMTLIKISGRSNAILDQRNTILPFIHTAQQRKDCAQWWREYFVQRHPYITQHQNPNASASGYPGSSSSFDGANDPLNRQLLPRDAQSLKLTAQIAHYAQNTTDILNQFRWDHSSNSLDTIDDSQPVLTRENVARQLQDSLDRLTAAHFHLVRTHPDAREFTTKIDQIELRNQTHLLLSDNYLQRILVHWQTTGQILEILIKEADEAGQSPIALNRMRLQRSPAATNSMEAVRDLAFYNLLLWDYLVSISQVSHPSRNVI